jgi:hypothetical protein
MGALNRSLIFGIIFFVLNGLLTSFQNFARLVKRIFGFMLRTNG